MHKELERIKDKFGEEMMHYCRKEFPTILEIPDLLYSILYSRFDYNKELYTDLVNNDLLDDFREFIYSEAKFEYSKVETDKSPRELLKEAGYTLYECKTKQEIDYFKRYFKKEEELCSFRLDRLRDYYVFFAVKDNVDKIRRKDFPNPQRQDEYGTSVISIQFCRKGTNDVRITNRYNHVVENPDATFSNNLDNIIPGLTDAFEKTYGFHIYRSGEKTLSIPGYIQTSDLKFHKYNYSALGVYFCSKNKIVNNSNVVLDYSDRERYLFIDGYILDLKDKTLISYNKSIKSDAFTYGIIKFDKAEVLKEGDNKVIRISREGAEDIYIEINKFGRIISYINNNTSFLGGNFMKYNTALRYLRMDRVESMGNYGLYSNRELEELILPSIKVIGSSFMYSNNSLRSLYLPSLEKLGACSFYNNTSVRSIETPNIQELGSDVFDMNEEARKKLESNVLRLKL